MLIAVVNRNAENDYRCRNDIAAWKLALEQQGHQVDVADLLSQLPRPLTEYDVAVAHPTLADARTLGKEVLQRRGFRWYIDTSAPDNYAVPEILESSQVRAGNITARTLNRIMEEWKD